VKKDAMVLLGTHDSAAGPGRQLPQEQRKLRELAAWYREFAERTDNPVIWEARLRTAENLEEAADRLEKGPARARKAV
jgi:hypothetical protein